MTSCPLCGDERAERYIETYDHILGRDASKARFVRCETCSLIYQNPRPSPDEIDLHYPDEYLSFFRYQGSGDRIDRGARRKVRYLNRFIRSGKVLDVGCGEGSFLASLEREGEWQAAGVEPNQAAASAAIERFGLEIFQATLEDAHLDDNSYDVVTMWDVLEHLHDPVGSLREVHRILRPGGFYLARVPNVAGWEATLFGESWGGWDAPRHLAVYSPETLVRALRESNFRFCGIMGGAEDYSSFAISLRFWNQSRTGSPPVTRGKGLLDQVLVRAMLYPIFALSGASRLRSRITIAAQKQGA